MDVAEKNTFCQMAHQPSVILKPVNIAVLHSVFVEVVQLIVNVSTALTIEQVRLFKICARKSLTYLFDLFYVVVFVTKI